MYTVRVQDGVAVRAEVPGAEWAPCLAHLRRRAQPFAALAPAAAGCTARHVRRAARLAAGGRPLLSAMLDLDDDVCQLRSQTLAASDAETAGSGTTAVIAMVAEKHAARARCRRARSRLPGRCPL